MTSFSDIVADIPGNNTVNSDGRIGLKGLMNNPPKPRELRPFSVDVLQRSLKFSSVKIEDEFGFMATPETKSNRKAKYSYSAMAETVSFVDYTKVEPIDHMKTLSRINFFVVNSISFLNHFASVCEEKLTKVHSRITKIEATLTLLESKLTHIPGLEGVLGESYASTTVISDSTMQALNTFNTSLPSQATATSHHHHQNQQQQQQQQQQPSASTTAPSISSSIPAPPAPPPPPGSADANATSAIPPPPPPAPVSNVKTVRQDERFVPFFKMLAFGVPDGAVRLKMQAAGLDPNFLDTPEAPAPPQGGAGLQRPGTIPLMGNHTGDASSVPPSEAGSDSESFSSGSDD